jgi:hypothetical protein
MCVEPFQSTWHHPIPATSNQLANWLTLTASQTPVPVTCVIARLSGKSSVHEMLSSVMWFRKCSQWILQNALQHQKHFSIHSSVTTVLPQQIPHLSLSLQRLPLVLHIPQVFTIWTGHHNGCPDHKLPRAILVLHLLVVALLQPSKHYSSLQTKMKYIFFS